MADAAATVDDEDQIAADGPDGQGAEGQAAEPNPEAERLAGLMGWKPKEQWKGDQTTWRPAEDFLRETVEVNRNMRAQQRTSETKLARVVAEVAKLSNNERQRMGADAEARLRLAVEEGKTDDALKILKEVEAGRQPTEPAAFTSFKERNADWYSVDPEATAYVHSLDQQFAAAAGGPQNVTDPEAHFRRIDAAMKKRFPELYAAADDEEDDPPARRRREPDEPQGRRAPLVARGNRAEASRSTEKTASTLSREEKAGADLMGVTHADYAKQVNNLKARGVL